MPYVDLEKRKLNSRAKYYRIKEKNPEKLREKARLTYYKHRESRISRNRDYNKEKRLKFLQMYGNKCQCCGESIYEFLALDHVKGVDRRVKGDRQSYTDAIKVFDPEEYRILCHNCNQATKDGKICPHVTMRLSFNG